MVATPRWPVPTNNRLGSVLGHLRPSAAAPTAGSCSDDMRRRIKIGVLGAGRGRSFMNVADAVGFELVAICDNWPEKLAAAGTDLGCSVTSYAGYDAFLRHPGLEAVILCNFFHEHAPFAIRALEAGMHVMSECAACGTLAEGVALTRAVERSGKIYMFAENYPYMAYNQEMKRLYEEGAVGSFRYGEGEYVHPDPAVVKLARSVGTNHWRNWMPATYYCTHALAPVMFITDTRPVKVNGFVVPSDPDDRSHTLSGDRRDVAGPIICRMDNGAVVKLLQGALRGHGNYTRIHGNQGLMESLRSNPSNRLRVLRELWEDEVDPEQPASKAQPASGETVYTPQFPAEYSEAGRTGHGGGDFFTSHHFAEAIRSGQQPFLDVYRGVSMSIVGILAWRSALNDRWVVCTTTNSAQPPIFSLIHFVSL